MTAVTNLQVHDVHVTEVSQWDAGKQKFIQYKKVSLMVGDHGPFTHLFVQPGNFLGDYNQWKSQLIAEISAATT